MQFTGIAKYKPDVVCVLVIAALSIFFLHNIIGTERLMDNGHHLHEQTFFSYNYKEAFEHKTLPFWTPYWYSGQPLYGDAQVFFLNLTSIFILLFNNIVLSINLSLLSYFFLSGLGMYLLAKNLTKSHYASLASSIVYMFNALIDYFVISGNPSILEPYSLIPFAFLFVLKAAKAEEFRRYSVFSIFAGILLAFQIYSGGMIIFLYTLVLICFFLVYDFIVAGSLNKIKKYLAIGLIVLAVCFGISAIKLIPNIDFIKYTSRESKVSYQEYIGDDKFVLKDFFKVVPFNGKSSGPVIHIGIVSFLLVLLALTQFRKKMVIFSMIMLVFSAVLASGGGLAYLFYKLPAFSQTRHVARVLFLFVFAASILTGYGFLRLSSLVRLKLIKSNKLFLLFVFLIIALISAELISARSIPKSVNVVEQVEENHMANYLKEEKEKFRINTFDVKDLVAFYGSSYYAQHGLETMSGGGGVWVNDYIEFLAIAGRYNPSKLQGILNVKYASSTKEVNVSGFKLVKKFDECLPCKNSDWTVWIGGPYLYENEGFLPRYYTVDNGILVVGNDADSKSLIYNLLLNENFNPETAVIVRGKEKINDYSIAELKNYKIVLLTTGSVDSSSLRLLEEYSKLNGVVLPDIINNKLSFEYDKLNKALASLKGDLAKADAEYFSQNKITVKPKKPGFLVLSERFYRFPDWKAETKSNKKTEILQADNAISSVLAESDEAVIFTYKPKSFVKGMAITVITAIMILVYLAALYWAKRK